MNRAGAVELVAKLAEVTVDRGATPNEAEVAEQKALALIERFDLRLSDFQPAPAEPPPPSAWKQGFPQGYARATTQWPGTGFGFGQQAFTVHIRFE